MCVTVRKPLPQLQQIQLQQEQQRQIEAQRQLEAQQRQLEEQQRQLEAQRENMSVKDTVRDILASDFGFETSRPKSAAEIRGGSRVLEVRRQAASLFPYAHFSSCQNSVVITVPSLF